MEAQRVFLDGWPALMSMDLACRYLSVDEPTFRSVAMEYRLDAVELEDSIPRWKKADLDRLTKRLPTHTSFSASHLPAGKPSITDADIQKIVRALAEHVADTGPRPSPELVSIKEASRLLGLGRSTIYKLMNEGRLETRRIGARTLIPRASIELLLESP